MVFALYTATALLLLWLVHRFVTPLSRAAALVLFVLPLAITGYAVFTGGVYGPVDYPYQTEPLSALKPLYGIDRPHNAAATDVYGTMMPFRRTLQMSLARGEWPLWNAYMLHGNVFAATAQAAQYSPFTLIACLLPAAVSFTYTCAVWLLIASIGAFLLARELGCSEIASLIAAAGWTYAASTILYIHTAMGGTLVYEPLLMMAAGRVARRPRISSAILLAIVLTLMIFAGHPETLFLATLAGAAYGIFELVRARAKPWRAIGFAIAGGVLALLLSAIHLLPFREAVEQSAELEVKTKYFSTAGFDTPTERVLSIVATEFFPFLHVRQWVNPPLGLTQAETSACGSLILALAIYAVWRRRTPETWFFFALVVICIAVASRWNPVVRAINALPLMGITYEERLAFTAAFSLAILAALGVDELLRRRDSRGAASTLTIVLVALAIGTWWLTRNVVVAITFADFGDFKIFAELFFLGCAALLLVFRPPLRVVAPALLALIVGQRVLSEGGTFKTFPAEVAYPPIPIFEPLKNVREPFRFTGQFYALLPGTNAFYGLEEVRGFDALHFGPSIKLWPLWTTFQPIWFNRVDDVGRPFLSFLNVRYAVITGVAPIPEGWREVARQRGAVLVENTRALDRAFVPRRVRLGLPIDQQVDQIGQQADYSDVAWLTADVAPYERENGPGRVRIAEYSPGGRYALDATMERDGWIVISETAWKGWRAYVDGRRVAMQTANVSFLAVHVPPGRHNVRVVYWPESFVLGRAVSFATLAALIVFALVRRLRRRSIALVLLAIVACREEPVAFPAAPPTTKLGTHARKQAGADAVDCGTARDAVSSKRVNICASEALREHRPFFCVYENGPAPTPFDVAWMPASVVAFAGLRDGTVVKIEAPANGHLAISPAWAPDDPRPRHLERAMTPPRVLRSASIDTHRPDVDHIVVVEVILDSKGTVSDARITQNPLVPPDDVIAVVKASQYEPARFFGVPRPVIFNFVVQIRRGVIRMEAPAAE